jgi:hypothetical protein
MHLTRDADLEWTPRAGGRAQAGATHRPTEIKLLHAGDPGQPGNFEMVVARYPAPRDYPIHRHNIDQLRYTLVGASPWAPGRETPEGSLVYIPSGTFYGPYTRPAGVELMAIQFEGPSRARFTGDDSSQTGPMPSPRFTTSIEMHPRSFAWLDVAPGVQLKELGSFTERGVRLAQVAVGDGGSHAFAVDQATLLFVTAGAGRIDGQEIAARDGIRLDAGESVVLESPSRIELLIIGLPRQPAAGDASAAADR